MAERPAYIEIDTELDREDFLRREVPAFLSGLAADAAPLWGMMRGQHMVEHLTYITGNCMGLRAIPLMIDEEKLPKYKGFLMSRYGFTRNFKFPLLPEDDLVPLHHPNMAAALDANREAFKSFMEFLDDPAFTAAPHPFYGPMNREEAVMFQYKHHLHHMMQFGYVA